MFAMTAGDDDGGELGLNVWDAFERCVRLAERTVNAYGPEDQTWAPEDDTNPVKVVAVPKPDPAAEPVNGVRLGTMLASDWVPSEQRRLLTGPDERGLVRLSDHRDGGGNFGGYFISASDVGKRWTPVGDAA
jgi:hypothetical protein